MQNFSFNKSELFASQNFNNIKDKLNETKDYKDNDMSYSFNDTYLNNLRKKTKSKDIYHEESLIVNVCELNERIKELEEDNIVLQEKYIISFNLIQLGLRNMKRKNITQI